MSDSHKNSKTVSVFRAGSFLSRAQGSDVESYLSGSKKSIGSYWESPSSKRIGSGLSFKEEDILMPLVLDVPKEDREFRKAVTTFFSEIDTHIPHNTGRVFEIGLDSSNEMEVSANNRPINIMDYLRFRHLSKHPQVAKNKEEADGNQLTEFYIFDKADVIKKNTKKTDEKDTAIQLYLEIKSDEVKVNAMLTLMELDPREYTGNDAKNLRVEALRKLAEEKSTDFVTLYNEADLDIRYWIRTMLNTGVLRQIGAKILDGETSKLIGNTVEETIFFFKDEENSESVVLYKTRMQESLKNPIKKNKKPM